MVPIGQNGRITKGEQAGWFVLVQDDRHNTGGYLILQSPDDFQSSGFDGWVEAPYLDDYFAEADWEVAWLPVDPVHP